MADNSLGGVALIVGIASAAIGAFQMKKEKYEMALVCPVPEEEARAAAEQPQPDNDMSGWMD